MNEENKYFQVSLKLILKNKEGEILLLKMPDTSKTMAGFYDLPGGRIKSEEAYDEFDGIIKREIEEELGKKAHYKITFKPVAIGRHNYFSQRYQHQIDMMCIFFETQYLGGELSISEEHGKYEWIKLDKNKLDKYFVRGLLEGMTNYFYIKEINNEEQ